MNISILVRGSKKRIINMPFSKITKGKSKGKYKSPTGRIFTKKQVKLYYATKGFKKSLFKKKKR